MRIGFASSTAAVMALLFAVAHVAGATGVGGHPLPVQSTSLTQNGQQLVWQLQMSQPFSPGALARDRRTLCLLVERAEGGAVIGQLCLAGPREGQRVPQVLYASVVNGVSGRARAIDATITRGSNRDLTASFVPPGIGSTYKPLRWQVLSTLAPPACTAPGTGIPPASACQFLFPARPALLELHTPKLVGCVAAGSKWVFNGPADVHDSRSPSTTGRGSRHRSSWTCSSATTCRRRSSKSASGSLCTGSTTGSSGGCCATVT